MIVFAIGLVPGPRPIRVIAWQQHRGPDNVDTADVPYRARRVLDA